MIEGIGGRLNTWGGRPIDFLRNCICTAVFHKRFLRYSLESDIEKLKAELRASRAREQDLRHQIQQLSTSDKSVKNELQQLRQNNEQLQTRYAWE